METQKAFPWGTIVQDHRYGDFLIREYLDKENGTLFHVYIDGGKQDTNTSVPSLEEGILAAFGEKYGGQNSQFASFAKKMLGIG